jgi:hypothetical protein
MRRPGAAIRRAGAWALVVVAVHAAPARAQSPVEPPADERPTITIGPVELRPRFRLANIGVDSNVFNDWDAPKSDFTLTVAPDVEVGLEPGRVRMTFGAGTEFVYFKQYESERSTNHSFTASVEADLSLIRPFASYTSAHTSARTGNEIDARARRYPRMFSGGSRFVLASRTSLTLTARRAEEEYDDAEEFRGAPLAETLNSTTTAYEGAFSVDLTPLTTLSLGVARESTRFEFTPRRDSNSLRIAPLLTFSPLGLLTGTASIGYRRFDGVDPSLPDYAGLTASGSLSVLLGGRYKVETVFARDVRYSYEETLPYYVQNGGRLSVVVGLLAGFDARVMLGRETMDYRAFDGEASGGTDRFQTYGGGVGYRVGPQVQLVLTAEYVERESATDVTREYTNHRIFGALNWGVTSR